jgi:hypothetical protein
MHAGKPDVAHNDIVMTSVDRQKGSFDIRCSIYHNSPAVAQNELTCGHEKGGIVVNDEKADHLPRKCNESDIV